MPESNYYQIESYSVVGIFFASSLIAKDAQVRSINVQYVDSRTACVCVRLYVNVRLCMYVCMYMCVMLMKNAMKNSKLPYT